MYGGDLHEFGTFADFHPYCDTPFYPPVLDSLLPGPRGSEPILLGEFNDTDVHRDLIRLHDELPFWASALPELNDQGVRWQHDLPNYLMKHPLATGDDLDRHQRLVESSRSKALFVRKTVHEWVRSRDPISGYVVTGWRDTPISTAGFFDDWGNARFSPEECSSWNGPNVLFLIPTRRPPWVDGGNRPGWMDAFSYFVGQVFFKVGIHSELGCKRGLVWRILDARGTVVARGTGEQTHVEGLEATQVGQISWDCQTPGTYTLQVEFGSASNAWPFHVEAKCELDHLPLIYDLSDLMTKAADNHGKVLGSLSGIGTKAAPFWREAAYEFASGAPFDEQWERLLAVSGDRVLDLDVLVSFLPKGASIEILINRVDVRTYHEAPVMIRATWGGASAILTTLRPQGGLGIQPYGLDRNPAGTALISKMMELIK